MKYPVTYISQSVKMMRALLVSEVVTALFLLLTAALVYRAGLDESKVQIAVILIYIVSCFLGGFLAGKMMKTRKFLWGGLLGFLYFAVMLLVSVAVNQEFGDAVTGVMTTFVICTVSGMAGGMCA